MKMPKIFEGLSRKMARVGFQVKRVSPEICTGAMVIFVVTGTVLAFKDAPKAEKIRAESAEQLKQLIEKQKAGELTEQDAKEKMKEVRRERNVSVVKASAPSCVLILTGITAGVLSDIILRKWLHKTTIAFAGLAVSFAAYRKNVVDDAGEEKDRQYRFGIKKEEKTVVDENGKKTKKTVTTVEKPAPYDYRIFFDASDYGIDRYDNNYNLSYFHRTEDMLTDIGRAKGFLYLNDVAAVFHKPLTEAGQVVGWVFPKGDEEKRVDLRVVDFMDEYNKGQCEDLMYCIDPNVDGPIIDKCVELGLMMP